MVEFGNNCDPDEEFDDDLLSILDFPMEFLEGDGLVEDWDITNSQSFGPIPSSVLMGPPMLPNKKIDTGPARLFPGPVAAIAGAPKQKHLPNHVDTSGSHIRRPSKIAEVQESGAFETQSPISVLESNGSCLGGKSLSIKSNSTIPVRSRSKRARPAGVNPWLLASPRFSTFQKTSNARRSRESRKKLFQQPVAMDFMKDIPKKFGSSLAVSDSAHLQNASSHRPSVIKKCTHCESTKTPQWREGPLGPKTLCNACGVRFRSGRLFPEYRPAASPTFVPSQHSNSHKKVVEMRNRAKQLATKIKVAPISPQLAAKTAEPPVSPQPEAKTIEPPISQWADVKTEEPPVSPQPEFVPMSSYLFDYMY